MTIGAYIEALIIGSGRFRTLKSIHCALNQNGEPIFYTHKDEVQFEVIIEGQNKILHCGGNYENSNITAKITNQYAVLTGEMLVFDTLNRASWIDIIIEEIPNDANAIKIESDFIDFDECEFVGELSDTFIRFCKDGQWGYADKFGNRTIKLKFSDADDFYEGRAKVRIDSKYGVIDSQGEYIMQPEYEQLEWWGENNIITASYNGQWQLYNRMGQPISKTSYNWIGECSEETFVVERGGKFGYIRSNGTPITPLRFDEAYSFINGQALAIVGGINHIIKK